MTLKQRLSLFLILWLGAGCQTTPSATPTHMLRLVCEGVDQTNLQSRIAVLDVNSANHDFGIATGHAIPPERPCAVRDFEGRKRSVNIIKLADNYEIGEKSDWAIIRFDKITTPKLVRYKLEPLEDIFPLEQQKFSFARARGLPENSQLCTLTVLDFSNGRNRVTHDCRAVPGQSGSPITRVIDGEHKLVGLHIGQLWMFQAPDTGRPDRRGYINLLDRGTISEIQQIISQNQD